MAKKRFINIIIAPEDRSGTTNLRLSIGLFYVISIVLSVLFVGVIALIFNQAMDEAKLGELKLLKRENEKLGVKLERFAEIEEQIHEVEIQTEKLKVIAGIEEAGREMKPVDIDAEGNITLETVNKVTISDGIRDYHNYLSDNPGASFAIPQGAPLEKGWLSRGFGERDTLGPSGFHPGVDYAVKTGTPIKATAAGVVVYAGEDNEYGNLLIIDHGFSGYSTFYGHCSEFKVAQGDKVKKGKVIALSGNSGESSAPHLHYEVRLHGIPVNAIKYITRPGEFVVIDVGSAGPEIIPAKEITTTEEDTVTGDSESDESEGMDDSTAPTGESDTTAPPPDGEDDGGAIPPADDSGGG